MKPTTDLFELIQMLSRSEKRYFRLNTNLQKGDKGYLFIFEEILKMKEYDESLLKTKLKVNKVKVAQLHVAKYNLYQLVLRSLRSFHEKKSTQQKLFALMADADILEAKGLYYQCLKRLQTAEKMAKKFEFNRLRGKILQQIINVKMRTQLHSGHTDLEGSYNEIESADAKIGLETRSSRAMHLGYLLYQSRGKTKRSKLLEEIQKFKKHELPWAAPSSDKPFYPSINYYFCQGLLSVAEASPQECHEAYTKMMEAWEKYPHMKKIRSKLYKAHLINYIDICTYVLQYDEIPKYLAYYQNIPDKGFSEEATSAQNYFHIKLLYFLNTGRYSEALELVPEIEQCFETYEQVLLPSRYLIISFNVFLLLFALNRFDEAFSWLDRIDNAKLPETRPDVQVFARVWKLILHYEMKDYDFLDYLRVNVYRDLRKRKLLEPFERSVLQLIGKLTNAANPAERQKLLKQFLLRLQQIEKKNKRRLVTGLSEVSIWGESRLTGTPYFSIMEKRQAEEK